MFDLRPTHISDDGTFSGDATQEVSVVSYDDPAQSHVSRWSKSNAHVSVKNSEGLEEFLQDLQWQEWYDASEGTDIGFITKEGERFLSVFFCSPSRLSKLNEFASTIIRTSQTTILRIVADFHGLRSNAPRAKESYLCSLDELDQGNPIFVRDYSATLVSEK